MKSGQCGSCQHGRNDAQGPLGPYWRALQRLPDPRGRTTVFHQPGDWQFVAGQDVRWTVTRSQSPGPVEGWSRNWRTGEREPHRWNRCAEFLPRRGTQEQAA